MEQGGRVAVVTGAGSGIGRVVALALLADGYCVVLSGRREETLRETLAEAGAGERALVVPADVTDAHAVRRLFARTVDRFGRLDVLFNNAGIFGPTEPFDALALADWDRVVATNLTGAFLCAQAAFRTMKRQHPQGGRIINNGSISAHTPRPSAAAYTATKHAITGLTKAISLEGRAYDIACGQIDIGNAATAMTAGVAAGALQADGSIRAEPTMAADHVGEAVRFMADLPLEANVQFLTIAATKMPFIGRG